MTDELPADGFGVGVGESEEGELAEDSEPDVVGPEGDVVMAVIGVGDGVDEAVVVGDEGGGCWGREDWITECSGGRLEVGMWVAFEPVLWRMWVDNLRGVVVKGGFGMMVAGWDVMGIVMDIVVVGFGVMGEMRG